MSKEKLHPSQSISINDGHVSGQVGQAGGDVNQSQTPAKETLASVEVVTKLLEIKKLIQNSNLPNEHKNAIVSHVEVVKEEAEREKPEKSLAATSLKRATEILQTADKTVNAGQGLFNKIQPIIKNLLPWFDGLM